MTDLDGHGIALDWLAKLGSSDSVGGLSTLTNAYDTHT